MTRLSRVQHEGGLAQIKGVRVTNEVSLLNRRATEVLNEVVFVQSEALM